MLVLPETAGIFFDARYVLTAEIRRYSPDSPDNAADSVK